MNIEKIKEFLEWSEGVPYLEVYEGAWLMSEDGRGITYALCGDLNFLYSNEINDKPLRKDGLVLVNIDNGYGETITMVFLESEEVK